MLSIFSYICWPSVYLLWRNVFSSPLPSFKDLDLSGFSLQKRDLIFLRILYLFLFFQLVKPLSLNLSRVIPSSKNWPGKFFLPIVRKSLCHVMWNSLKCCQGFLLGFNYLSKSNPYGIPLQSRKQEFLWKSC